MAALMSLMEKTFVLVRKVKVGMGRLVLLSLVTGSHDMPPNVIRENSSHNAQHPFGLSKPDQHPIVALLTVHLSSRLGSSVLPWAWHLRKPVGHHLQKRRLVSTEELLQIASS